MAAITDIKDISVDTPEDNTSVLGVTCSQNNTNIGQVDDIARRILSVMARADHGTLPIKVDTISESTSAAGVTVDGVLVKDGDLPGLGGTAENDFVRMAAGPQLPAVSGAGLVTIGALVAVTAFTASGTWTKTAGVSRILVVRQDPGAGGGGSSATDDRLGAGGGAGAYAENLLDVTSIASSTITINAPGAGGGGTADGSAGGTVVWNDGTNTLTSTGAAGGGQGGNSGGTSVTAGGVVSDGDVNIPGGQGGAGGADTASASGHGGDAILGKGTPHVARQATSASPVGYGGGGCGGHGGASAIAGGDGAPGIIVVYEYK